MSHTLRITNKLRVTPLCDIHQQDVAHAYIAGLSKPLTNRGDLVPVSFLVSQLQQNLSSFDGQHHAAARKFVGAHLGALHGSILTETGSIRQDVTTLAALDTTDARRGYRAGRHWFFYEALPQERRMTDTYLIERLYESAEDCTDWHDHAEQVWQYIIACYLGELSGSVFPLTQEERACWDRQERAARATLMHQDIQRDTEPLDPVPAVEYTM